MNYIKTYIRQKQQYQQQQSEMATTSASSIADFDRILKLLLKLNILRALEPDLVEDLFFTNLIGSVQIGSVIPHILKLGGSSLS